MRAKIIYSGGMDVDILPEGASKGDGLKFLLRQVHAGKACICQRCSVSHPTCLLGRKQGWQLLQVAYWHRSQLLQMDEHHAMRETWLQKQPGSYRVGFLSAEGS